MSLIGKYAKQKAKWLVWGVMLLLFAGAVLGLVFKTGHDVGTIAEAKAWETKIETLGYKTGEEVKTIEELHKLDVAKLTAEQNKVQEELQAAVDSGDARIDLQIEAATEWKRKYIQRGRAMNAMKDTLTEAERRLENPPAEGQHPCSVEYDGEEIHVSAETRECHEALFSWFYDGINNEPREPEAPEPCTPGYVDLRGGCKIQLVSFHPERPPSAQVLITAEASGGGWSEEDPSVGWYEIERDIPGTVSGFDIARPVKEKSWSLWTQAIYLPQDKIIGLGERLQWKRWSGTLGVSYALDPPGINGPVGLTSPEHLKYSTDAFRVYFAASRKH